MESWSYASGVKNFVSDESVSVTDGISRIRNGLSGWGLKPSSSFRIGNSSVQTSDHDVTKSQELDELGSLDMMSSLANGSIRDVVSLKFGSGRILSQLPAPLSSASGEEESSSKLSSSIVESNRDSPLIDLKLGRFPDHKDAKIKGNANFSQAVSSMSAKKPRAGSLSSQRPYCQVHGCRKDLSSSKDYHKRHKVCEIHSKTTKVIVDGIEQRFCQQCSRFHLLAAFDAGKRSCRKRLAGHNERRRKPHIGIHAGRAGRVYQSFSGARFEGTSAVLSSFVCQDILPSSLLQPEKYEMNNWCKNLKVEDRADCGPEPAFPKPNGQTRSNSRLFSFGSDKQRSPLHDGGFSAMTRTDMNQKNHACMHNVSSSDFVSHPVFHNTTIGSEDFIVLNSPSSVAQELPAASSYGCALSLLSSQSQNSSIHSSRIPAGVPMITPSCHAHYNITQVSEKLMRVSSQTSTTGVSNSFRSSGINSSETQIEPILISDGSDSVDYGMGGIIPGSEYMNSKNQLSCEDGSTIDLLQLSSQLYRVENQRQSMKVKEENDAFFGLRIT